MQALAAVRPASIDRCGPEGGAFVLMRRIVGQMRTEQAELERQLWHERQEIQQKHEDRVKTARTKLVRRMCMHVLREVRADCRREICRANIIGAGLTQYEADVRLSTSPPSSF